MKTFKQHITEKVDGKKSGGGNDKFAMSGLSGEIAKN